MTLGNSKDTKVESTGFQVDKNVIYYGNIHDYIADDGYENLAFWVEMAAQSMGK